MALFLLVAKPDQKATFLLAIRNISTNLTCLILQLMRTDMVLTKDQIAKSFQHNNGLTKRQSTKIVEIVLETIKAALAGGEDVNIRGFGKFRVFEIKTRQGRNPYTGGKLSLLPKTIVKYKCSPKLSEKVNIQAQKPQQYSNSVPA